MTTNLFVYVIGFAVVFLALGAWLLFVELRLRKFFGGKKAGDLEGVLVSLRDDLTKMGVWQAGTDKHFENVEGRLKNSIQKVGTIRFNPFKDSGSNQSFAVAFLDESGDGVVISSLYSREGVRVYAKPIEGGKSEYTLSEEESEAIKMA